MPIQRAFSLIELLVVTAILALLAMIGAPNYQSAETACKVGAVRLNLRTLAGALEFYHLDHDQYPRQGAPGTRVHAPHGLAELTTPLAYVSHYPEDAFACGPEHPRALRYGILMTDAPRWFAWSIGPDGTSSGGWIPYDPTNGVLSPGDLVCRR